VLYRVNVSESSGASSPELFQIIGHETIVVVMSTQVWRRPAVMR